MVCTCTYVHVAQNPCECSYKTKNQNIHIVIYIYVFHYSRHNSVIQPPSSHYNSLQRSPLPQLRICVAYICINSSKNKKLFCAFSYCYVIIYFIFLHAREHNGILKCKWRKNWKNYVHTWFVIGGFFFVTRTQNFTLCERWYVQHICVKYMWEKNSEITQPMRV